MYSKIREKILKHRLLFQIIHFFFTPIRVAKEFFARRKMAIQLIRKYDKVDRNSPKIFYFGVPEHNNLGDLAQTYCTRKWIEENYSNAQVIEVRTRISFDRKFLNYLKSILTENDLFLFQSGYCSRHKNPDHLMHKNILKRFPEQKAVILPQTVNIKSEKDIAQTKKIFDKCKHLLFIARDQISFQQAKAFTKESQLVIFPDIVTSLIGRNQKNDEYSRKKREGILFCVRNDDEKYYTDDEIEATIERLTVIEKKVDRTDTNSDCDVWETYNNLEAFINEKTQSFSQYRVIITDRFHGTIFSLIADTPVIVIKTNDHKVTAGLEWFKGIYDEDSVCYASDLNEAEIKARKIISLEPKIINGDDLYRIYYQYRLKKLIDKL